MPVRLGPRNLSLLTVRDVSTNARHDNWRNPSPQHFPIRVYPRNPRSISLHFLLLNVGVDLFFQYLERQRAILQQSLMKFALIEFFA